MLTKQIVSYGVSQPISIPTAWYGYHHWVLSAYPELQAGYEIWRTALHVSLHTCLACEHLHMVRPALYNVLNCAW